MDTQVKETPEQVAMRKAGLLSAISQLDMLIQMFNNAPETVKKTAKDFRDALEGWANGE